MTKPAAFTQAEISKVLKGAKAAGREVMRLEVDRSGRIVAHFDKEEEDAPAATEWDERIRAEKERPARERH